MNPHTRQCTSGKLWHVSGTFLAREKYWFFKCVNPKNTMETKTLPNLYFVTKNSMETSTQASNGGRSNLGRQLSSLKSIRHRRHLNQAPEVVRQHEPEHAREGALKGNTRRIRCFCFRDARPADAVFTQDRRAAPNLSSTLLYQKGSLLAPSTVRDC